MQSFCFDTLSPLVADADGTLVPSSSPPGPPEESRTSTQEGGRSSNAEQREDTAVEALMDQDATMERTDGQEGTPSTEVVTSSPTVLYIGGCPVDEKDVLAAESPHSTLLASSLETFGDVDVELTLRADHGGSAHVFSLKTVGGAAHGFDVQIPAGGDPTRTYLEYRVFDGMQLIVSMRQQAFPHEVQAIVFDIKSHEQLTLVARDDEILPLIERSARERLCDQIEQLVKFGSLGVAGSPELYRPAASGREIFPSDFVTRALQRQIPVVNVNIGQLTHEVPSELVTSRDLLYSCSRYVISPDLVGNDAASESVVSPDVDLDNLPLLRLSLSKKTYCQDFTFSIENARDGSGGESRMLHIRDKLTARPLGVYGEIQKLGDLRLHMLFMEDFLPRSLRIAVVEPVSGWSFQLIILDTTAPTSPKHGRSQDLQPYLNASPARNGLLNLFRNHLSVRRGLKSMPMLTTQPSQAELMQSTSQQQGTPAITGTKVPKLAKSVLLLRRTGFVLNNVVVLFTVSRELEADGSTFFLKATVSQATSATEKSVLLLTNTLDRILQACGLPISSELTIQAFDENSARKQVAEKFLEATEVNSRLDITLRLDKLPQKPPPTEIVAISAEEAAAAADDEQDEPAAAADSLLECDEERLLGRIDRMWAVEAAPPPAEETDGGDQLEPTLRVEVYDGSDCMEALFHSTNLRLRVTDLAIGRIATRDMHEEDLEPWLAAAHAQHLLSASRESDLIDMVLKHASLAEPGKSPRGSGVVLLKLSPDVLTNTRYSTSFLQSAEAQTRGSVSGAVK